MDAYIDIGGVCGGFTRPIDLWEIGKAVTNMTRLKRNGKASLGSSSKFKCL